MEDTLRDNTLAKSTVYICLNPCFNGRYSQSCRCCHAKKRNQGLNPCFNGRYSQSAKAVKNLKVSLNPCFNGRYSQSDNIKRYRTNTRS